MSFRVQEVYRISIRKLETGHRQQANEGLNAPSSILQKVSDLGMDTKVIGAKRLQAWPPSRYC
jgi:hypothetical protein